MHTAALSYTIAAVVDSLGYPPLALALVAASVTILLLISKRHAAALLYSSVAAACLSGLLKLLFAVPRPDAMLIETMGYRFPSGHALFASAFLSSVCFNIWALSRSRYQKIAVTIACTLLIVTVDWSRVFLGVHLPIDVIAGSLVGIVVSLVVHRFVFRPRSNVSP
jgi:undecaprenyl-diphosphatase